MWIYLTIFLVFASVQSRSFNNPALGGENYFEPSVVKVNGTYYMVTDVEDETSGIFPIHSSTDLIHWQFQGYVFGADDTSTWARRDTLRDPEIHQIGNNIIVYYSAFYGNIKYYAVGATVSPHPLGPYTPTDLPLLSENVQSVYEPTIIKDEDKIYLLWRKQSQFLYARQLNESGLTFSADFSSSLFRPTLAWEKEYIQAANYFRRGDYHYIFYSGGLACIDMSVGVARSRNALGPYEKFPDPILVYNDDYYCTRHAVVVNDLDEESDVIVFNANYWGDDNISSVLLASLNWADDWPSVEKA